MHSSLSSTHLSSVSLTVSRLPIREKMVALNKGGLEAQYIEAWSRSLMLQPTNNGTAFSWDNL